MCPFHGFEYDTSGRCTLIPANGRSAPVPKAFQVQAYPTHEAHGFIFIWWGQPEGEVPPPRFFDDIDETFSYGAMRDPWRTHYSRRSRTSSIHRTCPSCTAPRIGRGGHGDGRTVGGVAGPRPDSSSIRWRPDDGTPPAQGRGDAAAGHGVSAGLHLPQPLAEPPRRRFAGGHRLCACRSTRTPYSICGSTRNSSACRSCATS